MRLLASGFLFLVFAAALGAQTQTTGGIRGTVVDQNGDAVPDAAIVVTSPGTGERRLVSTDRHGNYSVSFLPPGVYRVSVAVAGFAPSDVTAVLRVAEAYTIDVTLAVAGIADQVDVDPELLPVTKDTATLGQTITQRTLETAPLATRNFTQLIGLVPGVSTYLSDATNLGRNSNVFNVNGIRATQNNFQVNGVDVNAGVMRDIQFGTPAPDAIAEVRVQTSNYDATFGRAGGGSTQILTKTGSNALAGNVYYYFSDTSLNANDPFLKAAGKKRPVLVRNVFGGTLGGPLRKDREFFFISYQGTRERNGFSRTTSLRTGVFISDLLTDDRSTSTLMSQFDLPVIDLVAHRLLNAHLPDGRFVIPTPGDGGFYSTSEISTFRETQLNANVDLRLTERNWLAVKVFVADSPQFMAFSGTTLPGFGQEQERSYAILSIQDVHNFAGDVINEARFGYNFIREDGTARQPLDQAAIGIHRSNTNEFPGFPFLNIGGMTIGPGQRQDMVTLPSMSFTNTVSMRLGDHTLRIGGDARWYRYDVSTNLMTRGVVNISDFRTFLTGTIQNASLANGILDRDMRAIDYHLFFQDDWKLSSRLTLNLGIRYELDLPIYDTKGRLSTFDPTLYLPRMATGSNGVPIGPPVGGMVQAGNAIGRFDHPSIPNVADHALYGVDTNNFAPRVGAAYSPLRSDRFVLRAGYGIFYSRTSFQYAALGSFQPPFFLALLETGGQLSSPFPSVPAQSEFPTLIEGPLLFGTVFDRGIRTPYSQQWNGSLQIALPNETGLEVAYVGTRGVNLFRQVAINQAYLMGPDNPVRNVVTGMEVPSNIPGNAQLRAPLQGVIVGALFNSNQTVAQSTYHSGQVGISRRLSRGLQFLLSYTYSKSIDTASGVGGGAQVNGSLVPDFINDTSFPDGDQRDGHSSRGLSDFDRTHRFALSYVWDVPRVRKASKFIRAVLTGWQVSGIVTAMSGLPINIRDSRGAELFFGLNGGGDRPSWATGGTVRNAFTDVPQGYYFNPRAFRRAVVSAGQQIPSSAFRAFAGPSCPVTNSGFCTDFGNVGRNPIRGPRQINVDISAGRTFRLNEKIRLHLRMEAFNVLNSVNFANPVSNFNATINGGAIDNATGAITAPGAFGRITATSGNPRIVQFATKLTF